VKFKLFAARYHLNRLENIERRTGSLVSTERIEAEIEIDGFLCEIIGAKDALLQEINRSLGLGLAVEEVDLGSVNREISSRGLSPSITSELNVITQPCHWLWKLNEYRNHSVHRTLIPRFIQVEVGAPGHKTSLVEDPRNPTSGPSNLEVIPYFRDCLQKMRELVERTRRALAEVNFNWLFASVSARIDESRGQSGVQRPITSMGMGEE
jgi:hypothetical protein